MRENDPKIRRAAYAMFHGLNQEWQHGDPYTKEEWDVILNAAISIVINAIILNGGHPSAAKAAAERIQSGFIEALVGNWTQFACDNPNHRHHPRHNKDKD